jgi:hypothetical protein
MEKSARKHQHEIESYARSKEHQMHEKDNTVQQLQEQVHLMDQTLSATLSHDEIRVLIDQLDELRMQNDALRMSVACFEDGKREVDAKTPTQLTINEVVTCSNIQTICL